MSVADESPRGCAPAKDRFNVELLSGDRLVAWVKRHRSADHDLTTYPPSLSSELSTKEGFYCRTCNQAAVCDSSEFPKRGALYMNRLALQRGLPMQSASVPFYEQDLPSDAQPGLISRLLWWLIDASNTALDRMNAWADSHWADLEVSVEDVRFKKVLKRVYEKESGSDDQRAFLETGRRLREAGLTTEQFVERMSAVNTKPFKIPDKGDRCAACGEAIRINRTSGVCVVCGYRFSRVPGSARHAEPEPEITQDQISERLRVAAEWGRRPSPPVLPLPPPPKKVLE